MLNRLQKCIFWLHLHSRVKTERMCKYFSTIAIVVLAIILVGCNNRCDNSLTELHSSEAMAIADSLHSADELKRHIAYYDSINDRHSELLIRQKYGNVLRNRSQFDTAIREHEICIRLATELKDTIQLIIALNNQGTNFRRIGDLKEAANHHYAALHLYDKTTSDTSYIARKNLVRTLNGLGNVMLSLGNAQVAEEMFRRALQGERELHSSTGQAINYANIGAIKRDNNELDSARIYYNMSMLKNQEANNLIGISICYYNLGEIDETEGNFASARENYLKSYEIGVVSKDTWHWLNACTALAQLSFKEKNYSEALRRNNEALEAANRIKAKGRLARLYAQQANIYEATGLWQKALESTHIAQAYKDSINIEENRSHTHNLRLNYEINKRKEEINKAQEQLLQEKKIREITLWGGTITIILTFIAIAAILRAAHERKKSNKILQKTNKERQDFYRGITHQLRTPLTVLFGMTHELKRHIPEDDDIALKEFDAITRRSNDLLTLVDKMTEYNEHGGSNITINEYQESDNTTLDKLQQEETLQNYILVAEDDSDVAMLITRILKNEGYNFRWAKNGKEALEITSLKQPQLIITDIMMPELDGLELIKAIRADENTSHIPIIVVSARTHTADRITGIDLGAEAYLGKPFIPDELLMMTRRLLEQRDILKKRYSTQLKAANSYDYNEHTKEITSNEQDFIKQIDDYIHENIMNCNLSAVMLAEHLIMSTTTLNRKINSITGTNTTNYIRQRKLARARYLLTNSQMSMGEIQIVCGFESPSYFSRAFKAEFGESPTEYRKKQTN